MLVLRDQQRGRSLDQGRCRHDAETDTEDAERLGVGHDRELRHDRGGLEDADAPDEADDQDRQPDAVEHDPPEGPAPIRRVGCDHDQADLGDDQVVGGDQLADRRGLGLQVARSEDPRVDQERNAHDHPGTLCTIHCSNHVGLQAVVGIGCQETALYYHKYYVLSI